MWQARAAAAALLSAGLASAQQQWVSVLGDPGMTRLPAVGFTAWTFCNGALGPSDFPQSPSPRMCDCVAGPDGRPSGHGPHNNSCSVTDDALGPSYPLPPPFVGPSSADPNVYAAQKEAYMAALCASPYPTDAKGNWSGWQVMFKSGNMDLSQGLCPETGLPPGPSSSPSSAAARRSEARAPGFNNLPMNQPLLVHGFSDPGAPAVTTLPNGSVVAGPPGWGGYFAGTYDWAGDWTPAQVAAAQAALHEWTRAWVAHRIAEAATPPGQPAPPPPPPPAALANSSYAATAWYTNATAASPTGRATSFLQLMRTTPRYPWLMNYLRANAAWGQYGGYLNGSTGVMPAGATPATGTRLSVRLRILTSAPSAHDQFYLPEISSCWALDGSPCVAGPGATATAVTRYTCFIIAPGVGGGCSAKSQGACPPYHVALNGTRIYRNDTAHFPYECYFQHCPPNINGTGGCDAYSNPNPQELEQLLPCSEWAAHGFPATAEEAWLGQDRLWDLDVGALQARLYYSGAEPSAASHADLRARLGLPPVNLAALPPYPGWTRPIVSLEVGPEQMAGAPLLAETLVRWETLGWDVAVA